jgi:hypothetical protein
MPWVCGASASPIPAENLFLFDFLFQKMKQTIAMASKAPKATPNPMPAFAAVERPGFVNLIPSGEESAPGEFALLLLKTSDVDVEDLVGTLVVGIREEGMVSVSWKEDRVPFAGLGKEVASRIVSAIERVSLAIV